MESPIGVQMANEAGAEPGFDLQIVERPDVYVIRLSGALDLAAAQRVDDALRAAESSGASTIVVDLDRLTFIDSTGLRTLLVAHRRVQGTAVTLGFTRGVGDVAALFKLTALDRTLTFVDRVEPID